MDVEKLLNERNKRIKRLILFMVAVFSLALALGTMAWFASNKEVEGNDILVFMQDGSFELMVEGEAGLFDQFLPSTYTKAGANNPFRTNPEHTAIQWLVSENANIGNYESDDEDAVEGIAPGSEGQLNFKVIPGLEDPLELQFTLNLTAYRSGAANPSTLDDLTPVVSGDSDYDLLTGFLEGHILFFTSKDENGKYSGLIDDTFTETITFDKDAQGQAQPYPMTIYWIWPNTFEEEMLTDSDLGTGQKSVCSSTELLDRFAEHPEYFLDQFEAPENTTLDADYIRSQKTVLNRKYNEADQIIGDEIGYLVVELAAEQMN